MPTSLSALHGSYEDEEPEFLAPRRIKIQESRNHGHDGYACHGDHAGSEPLSEHRGEMDMEMHRLMRMLMKVLLGLSIVEFLVIIWLVVKILTK